MNFRGGGIDVSSCSVEGVTETCRKKCGYCGTSSPSISPLYRPNKTPATSLIEEEIGVLMITRIFLMFFFVEIRTRLVILHMTSNHER